MSHPFTFSDLDKERLIRRCNIDDVFSQFNASIAEEIAELVALRDSGQSPIPEVSFEQLSKSGFSATQAALVRKRGCVVVRQTFAQQQADQWNQQLADYLAANHYYEKLQEDICAGNVERATHPHMLDIYWSKTQLEVRQSVRLQQLQTQLNRLWNVTSSGVGAFDPNHCCSYADRIRIRQPLDQIHGLAPHVDSCSMEAWFSEQTIEQTYGHLLNGDWRAFDAFDAVGRIHTLDKPHNDSVGMFRTFQGWMALTAQGPHCGTLQ